MFVVKPINKLLIFWLLFAIAEVNADDGNVHIWQGTTTNDELKRGLSVLPNVCVIQELGDYCEQEIIITLTLTNKLDVCIYQQPDNKKIWCDYDVITATVKTLINTNKDVTLVIQDMLTGEEYGYTDVHVSVYQPVQKRRKRRYGMGFL
ncbi:DUF3019 domain-containing protein [Thalassotalea maritima]|uniref:DUF3019 domain-containing protein n=1 Tax=Thalassotalea maritima TaxID=3242416 RepID=UPI003528D002